MDQNTSSKNTTKKTDWLAMYRHIRMHTETICKPLQTEDYVVQPIVDVSPPKWHLGHTTWFFETFLLQPHLPDYQVFNTNFNYVFNSYYETIGARVIRTDRGNLSRPSVAEIYQYRAYVDAQMALFLQSIHFTEHLHPLLELGLNHEQQHQELLLADIKYILGHNPLFPVYESKKMPENKVFLDDSMCTINEGIYEIGYNGDGFCFDNEKNSHKVFLNRFQIATSPVTNEEYLQFIESGGYRDFKYWHAEGWDWVQKHQIDAPLYWHFIDDRWMYYTFNGLQEINRQQAVCHVSFYEAAAFAQWKEMRLPTEAEWEVAAEELNWGSCWEWTNSAYLPYPGFQKEAGAVGEYNGKFMVSQMVLRGASIATPANHSRKTYRNFFYPNLRSQFTGIRLAK